MAQIGLKEPEFRRRFNEAGASVAPECFHRPHRIVGEVAASMRPGQVMPRKSAFPELTRTVRLLHFNEAGAGDAPEMCPPARDITSYSLLQ